MLNKQPPLKMSLQLSRKLEFKPSLMKELFPSHTYLHSKGVSEVAELLGWPMSRTSTFFQGNAPVYAEDVLHVSLTLGIKVSELVVALAIKRDPDWNVVQTRYMNQLDVAHKKNQSDRQRTLAGIIAKRWNTGVKKV